MSKWSDVFKNLLDPEEKEAITSEEQPPAPDAVETAANELTEEIDMLNRKLEEAAVKSAVESVRVSVKTGVEQAVKDAIADAQQSVADVIQEVVESAEASAAPAETGKDASRVSRPHAFVVMPFGKKEGFDGTVIDFNAIYQQLIKPALEEAGFDPFRADEETTTGDILTDMFQELLLADLAICDLSIDNANVFYELGIRHAFRKRGIVHIQSGRAYMPFDIFNVRTIPYHTTEAGLPDPEFLEKDICDLIDKEQDVKLVLIQSHASLLIFWHSKVPVVLIANPYNLLQKRF